MKAVGIIAEYNPLHNGHVYHLEQAKRLSGSDAAVVAMSGDFVQRGEPAVFDKWTRARHALECGADLVVEIPVLFCLGNARHYGRAGVRLLESTGKVTHIAFGSESGDIQLLTKVADGLSAYSEQIDSKIRLLRSSGSSYPAAREKAFFDVVPAAGDDPRAREIQRILRSPNDILALEYIMAAQKAEPLAVRRAGAGYDDSFDDKFDYQSASAIRKMAFQGQDVSRFVPETAAADIRAGNMTAITKDNWFDMLRFAVMSAPADVIEDCPSGGEGLGNLIKREIFTAKTWDDLVSTVQSKRYTYTRISRLCMQVILGITRSAYPQTGPEYIRILGFSKRGRELLSEIRSSDSSELPVITNINKQKERLPEEPLALLELDKHASDIYNLICGNDVAASGDNIKHPVIYDI